jgi:hypothetical protein
VAISPDFGDRYAGNLYDDDWAVRRFGTESLRAAVLPGNTFIEAI